MYIVKQNHSTDSGEIKNRKKCTWQKSTIYVNKLQWQSSSTVVDSGEIEISSQVYMSINWTSKIVAHH